MLSVLTAWRVVKYAIRINTLNKPAKPNIFKSLISRIGGRVIIFLGLIISLLTAYLLFSDIVKSWKNDIVKLSVVGLGLPMTFLIGLQLTYRASNLWFDQNKESEKNALIYRTNKNGKMILHKINNSSISKNKGKLKVIGFLDDNPHLEGKHINGYPILGGHWKLPEILRKSSIDYIFIDEQDTKSVNFNQLKKQAAAYGIVIKQFQINLKNILSESDQSRISTQLDELKITCI